MKSYPNETNGAAGANSRNTDNHKGNGNGNGNRQGEAYTWVAAWRIRTAEPPEVGEIFKKFPKMNEKLQLLRKTFPI